MDKTGELCLWNRVWQEFQQGIFQDGNLSHGQMSGEYISNTLLVMISATLALLLAGLQRFSISRDISAAPPNTSEDYLM